MPAPIVVGIDPNLTENGIVVLQGTRLISDALVTSEPQEGVKMEQRINKIIEDIYKIIGGAIKNGYKPDLFVIENMAFSQATNAYGLGYLGYSLRSRLTPYIEPTPNQVKQFATGEGKASKSLMLLQVYKNWGVEYRNDNLADAYAMARLGVAYLTEDAPGQKLFGYQAKVINAIKNPPKKKTKKGAKSNG